MPTHTVPDDLPDRVRDRLGMLAASVSVVSAHGSNGPAAITVTSVTSVALEPPALLVCVNRRSQLLPAIEESAAFRVNYLAVGQSALADAFGTPGRGHVFANADWELGALWGPAIKGSLAQLGCELVTRTDYGSHAVLVGAVRDIAGEDLDPLIYVGRRYGQALPAMDAPDVRD